MATKKILNFIIIIIFFAAGAKSFSFFLGTFLGFSSLNEDIQHLCSILIFRICMMLTNLYEYNLQRKFKIHKFFCFNVHNIPSLLILYSKFFEDWRIYLYSLSIEQNKVFFFDNSISFFRLKFFPQITEEKFCFLSDSPPTIICSTITKYCVYTDRPIKLAKRQKLRLA